MANIIAQPPESALQEFLATRPMDVDPQTLTTTEEQNTYLQLSLQIAHNLRYQHNWTNVRLHRPSLSPNERPVLSGLPPTRLYVHPDEQLEFLQEQAKKATVAKNDPAAAEAKLEPEREWILPSHLRERWSLRRFAEAFDGLSKVPSSTAGEPLFDTDDEDAVLASRTENEDESASPWRTRQPKRLLLATLDDDSTVVYYIVHDGIVKPRQN